MPQLLPRTSSLRALTALVAAYAFALQMSLAGIVATGMAVAQPTAAAACLNGGDPAGKPGEPAHYGPCAVCAFASFSSPLPDAAVAAPAEPVASALLAPRPAAFAAEDRRHDPQSARGPPNVS